MTPAIVTVLVNGAFVAGSVPATLRAGIVVAPVVPYLARVAQRVDREGREFIFERAGRSVRVTVGSRLAWSAAAGLPLPIAPYLRAGEAIIPLAVVVRALGADVAYDGPTHTLRIELRPQPLATLTPGAPIVPGPAAPVTFAPTSTPAPTVTITGIPKPRRTPVVLEHGSR